MKFKLLTRGLLIFSFFISSPSWSQQVDFDNYIPLKASGTLPKEFSKTFDFKKKVSDNKKSNDKDQPIALSNKYLNDIMHSGDVLFNDPVGDYLNKIMRGILESNGINDEVRVYLLKSDETNAFAFQKDVILVTMGLIAQVSSEAELAFILCHEYVHYRDKHVEIELNENIRIEKEEKKSGRLNHNEVSFLKSRYSKDLELKADAGGLDLFLNTAYNIDAVSGTFDVLRFSDLPFEEEEFSLSFLESQYFKINQKYFLKDVAPVTIDPAKEKEDSKYSSHPDIETRRTEMLLKLETVNSAGKKDFIVSESEFYLYQKICRFEVCRLQLLYRDYANAFYSGYLLLEENPNSVYLKRVVTRALYGITTYGNMNKLSKVLTSTKKVAGNSQRVFYLFNEAKKKEINFLALNYGWRAHQQFPQDEDIKAVCDELISQAVNKHGLTPFYLKNTPPDTVKANTTNTQSDSTSVDTLGQNNDKKNNKYTKIKTVIITTDNKTNKSSKTETFDYLQYAFIDLADDAELKDRIKYFYERKKDEEDEEENTIKSKNKKKEKVMDNTRPQITDVVFVEPQQVMVDTRAKAKKNTVFSDNNDKVGMYANINKISKMLDVNNVIVDRYTVGEEDVTNLNEFGYLLDFVAEQSRHESKIVMLPTDYIELKNVQDKYGTPYIGLIGVASFRSSGRRGKILTNVLMPLVYWVALPYAIFRLAQPSYTTYIYSEVFDLETGKRVYNGAEEYEMRPHQDIVNGGLYDIIQEIRNKK
jgi:hypothetical protein